MLDPLCGPLLVGSERSGWLYCPRYNHLPITEYFLKSLIAVSNLAQFMHCGKLVIIAAASYNHSWCRLLEQQIRETLPTTVVLCTDGADGLVGRHVNSIFFYFSHILFVHDFLLNFWYFCVITVSFYFLKLVKAKGNLLNFVMWICESMI
jgi:hypothetical protein